MEQEFTLKIKVDVPQGPTLLTALAAAARHDLTFTFGRGTEGRMRCGLVGTTHYVEYANGTAAEEALVAFIYTEVGQRARSGPVSG